MTRIPTRALPLLSPVMIAAGCCPPQLGEWVRPPLGAVVVGSFGAHSRRGRRAVLQETVGGVRYTPTTARVSIAAVLRRWGRVWAQSPVPVIVSLVGETPESFGQAAAALEGARGVIAIELALGWRTDEDTPPLCFEPALVTRSVAAVRRACQFPVLVKVAYDTPDLAATLAACAAVRAIAATLGGGVPISPLALIGPSEPMGSSYAGGSAGVLCGPATFPLIRERVRQAAANTPLPIIASGGVATPAHALALLAAGAAAVQVGSALLANPAAAADLAAQISWNVPPSSS